MFRVHRTLLVIIALSVPSIGGAEEPAAAKSSSKADVWPVLEWKEAAPSPFARVESPAAVVNGKIYLFGGFTEDLDASWSPAAGLTTRGHSRPPPR